MDPVRIGQSLRALRIRPNHRQIDVASRAGVSRGTISAIERGMSAGVSFETLTGVAIALGATLDVRVRWRGAELDRLLDEGHARLVAHLAHRLTRLNWIVDV